MEDLQKALSDCGLLVSALPEKGRCLLTARDFSPGEVVINQEPYVCVPNDSKGHSRCDSCFSTSNLKRCTGCHLVWYCGSACQKSEWSFHRVECSILARIDKEKRKYLTPSVRLMVKLYLRRKLQNEKVVASTSTDNYQLVEALVSHMSDIDEKQRILYAQMGNLVNLILQWPDINLKEIAENFSKLACNAHTICDDELRPLGTGLYPVISIINHSCLPNAVLIFEGKTAVVRAVEHVPKGSEVLISYIETAGSTTSRKKTLKEQYLFNCTCPRCMKMGQYDDILESAILEGYRCKGVGCNGFMLRDSDDKGFVCQKCGRLRDKEEIGLIANEIRTLSSKVENLAESGNSVGTIYVYKEIEELQMKLFHSHSIKLMRTREAILKILLENCEWREALAYCRLTIPVYERVYIGVHPLLGLQYYTCGKLEWFLGETDDAVKSLTKAADILRITHGTKTQFMKELLFKLEEARAEACHKRTSYSE
ncbi:unnamed protein product [Rhodiola kirilowii]